MLVCLDVDGCLIDSDVPMLAALNDALGSFGLTSLTLEDVRPHLGPPLLVTMQRVLEGAAADARLAPELAARYRRVYRTASVTHATAHPGVSDALADLRDAGHTLAVVSSKPSEFSRPILQAVALLELFHGVFGPEGEESEPKDETLARALAAHTERPAIMVGDTVQDIAAARANRVPRAEPENAPANTLGIRRIMFTVDDIDDVVARLRSHGAEPVGEITRYEDIYRLCYVRGPEGIIIGLAEQLS